MPIKKALILSVFSTLIGVLGTLLIFYIFPQHLCYEVYNVSEGDASFYEDKRILASEQYNVYFIPQNNYLKNIAININHVATIAEMDSPHNYGVKAILTNQQGNVIAEDEHIISSTDVRTRIYCQFDIEKWVQPHDKYQLSIFFPNDNDVYTTFIEHDACSAEHISLEQNGELLNNTFYMQYVYGTYSKKILVLWFLVFYLLAYWISELIMTYFNKLPTT